MHRINAPIEAFDVTSIDGTRIRAYKAGKGYHRWLLPPGLGTPILSWKYLIEHFQDKMTIVTWEPRGCFDSDPPEDLDRMHVEEHVEDAFAILEQVGWTEGTFIVGGWSMAVQIGIEIAVRAPERVGGLVLINGAYEHVLQTAFEGLPNADVIMRGIANLAVGTAPVFAPVVRYLLSQEWAITLLKSMGIVAANADFLGEVVQDFRNLDFKNYFKMIVQMDEHSAKELLPMVKAPTLITAGDEDKMTPLSVSETMNERIPDSELFVIPRGTHYSTLEFPEIVNLKLEHFFRTRVFGDYWENPGAL